METLFSLVSSIGIPYFYPIFDVSKSVTHQRPLPSPRWKGRAIAKTRFSHNGMRPHALSCGSRFSKIHASQSTTCFPDSRYSDVSCLLFSSNVSCLLFSFSFLTSSPLLPFRSSSLPALFVLLSRAQGPSSTSVLLSPSLHFSLYICFSPLRLRLLPPSHLYTSLILSIYLTFSVLLSVFFIRLSSLLPSLRVQSSLYLSLLSRSSSSLVHSLSTSLCCPSHLLPPSLSLCIPHIRI